MPVASDHDDLLDIKEAAQFLNVSETSLRRWTNSGRLACVRLGRKRERRFRRADLLAFLEEQPAGAPPVSHVCGLYAAARRAGARALRTVGDVSGGPALRLARDELLEYERLYSELAQRFQVATLCLYDVRHASGLDVLDVLQCHDDFFPHPADGLVG